MSRVYIVTRSVDWEGSSIDSVYTNKVIALEAADDLQADNTQPDVHYYVEEWEAWSV